MSNCWVGVASLEHVQLAVEGGFCQLNHGKEAPLKRLRPGDRLLYYSPRERMRDGATLQAFTAVGEVQDGPVHRVMATETFQPFRRDVHYLNASAAPIRPLLSRLAFTRDAPSWGQRFMRGAFQIDIADYLIVAAAMGVTDAKNH